MRPIRSWLGKLQGARVTVLFGLARNEKLWNVPPRSLLSDWIVLVQSLLVGPNPKHRKHVQRDGPGGITRLPIQRIDVLDRRHIILSAERLTVLTTCAVFR
jgi:hypothetical protein